MEAGRLRNESVRPICEAGEKEEELEGAAEEEEMRGMAGREDEESNESESEDEAKKAKGAAVPIQPSQEQMRERMLTHLPYRDWCRHCVRGNSK